MRTRVVALSAVGAFAVVGLSGTPAVAEVPSNDNIENATVITSLPYTVEEDISEATKVKTDPRPPCDHGVRSDVWFTITPTTSGWLSADTKGSDVPTVAAVFTGSPGNLSKVACNDDTVRDGNPSSRAHVFWNAKAGTQYYLLIAKDYGRGGNLKLTVDHSAPPFSLDSLTVNSSGSTDNGKAIISGTMSCTSGPGEVYLEVFVQQTWARLFISGEGHGRSTCDGVSTWQVKVGSRDGVFSGGQADVKVRARWFEDNGGRVSLPKTTVLLHG